MAQQDDFNRKARRIALIIAGIGIAWIALTALGGALDWSQRTRAFFDLAVLAGFGWAIWMIYGLWRTRQADKGQDDA